MKIKQVTPADVIPLRHKILRPGRPIETAYYTDDSHCTTYHFACLEQTEIVGVVTFTKTTLVPAALGFLKAEQGDFVQLRGMAVDDNVQGKGIGRDLIRVALKTIKEENDYKVVWCNARTYALPFYKKLGFNVVGEEFEVPNVGPHFIMYKTL